MLRNATNVNSPRASRSHRVRGFIAATLAGDNPGWNLKDVADKNPLDAEMGAEMGCFH
jgi:hypothetical protein